MKIQWKNIKNLSSPSRTSEIDCVYKTINISCEPFIQNIKKSERDEEEQDGSKEDRDKQIGPIKLKLA